MNTERCAYCGWPEAEPYEVVSRHDTSEGTVVYTRCACGRLQVRRDHSAAPVLSSRSAAADAPTRGAAAGGPLLGDLELLVAGALVLTAAVRLPVAALAACGVVSVVVGMLGWVWRWLSGAGSGTRLIPFAVRAATVGGASALALTGMAAVFESATVVVLPLLYLVAGWWFWRTRKSYRRPLLIESSRSARDRDQR